jgi:hypothetical protein
VLSNIHIPEFDPDRPKHAALVVASRAAHAAIAAGEEPDQVSVDLAAGKLWGMTKAEVAASGEFLDMLLKRDLACS